VISFEFKFESNQIASTWDCSRAHPAATPPPLSCIRAPPARARRHQEPVTRTTGMDTCRLTVVPCPFPPFRCVALPSRTPLSSAPHHARFKRGRGPAITPFPPHFVSFPTGLHTNSTESPPLCISSEPTVGDTPALPVLKLPSLPLSPLW
jgi:hypothetical protein